IYSRRRSLLYLEELSGDFLRQIVKVEARGLETHHGVTIGDEAVDEAVTAAGHHTIPYRPPGSSVRLLDDACAHAVARGDKAVDPTQVKEAARTHVEAALGWDRPRLRAAGAGARAARGGERGGAAHARDQAAARSKAAAPRRRLPVPRPVRRRQDR